MNSTFTWLDYSERDRRHMMQIVDGFRERESRNDLGLDRIAGAFSEMLFPGTTTQQTRARYLLFVPWIYPVEGGARIERHVPALPLSREKERMASLRRSLAAYRMVFGQARQEDLVSYLLSRFDDEDVAALSDRLRIDLQPPTNGDRR